MHKDLIFDKLTADFKGSIVLRDELMKNHTTFKIGGPADIYIEPQIDDVPRLIRLLKHENIPYMVIGNGSNILVSDDGIEGVVVSLGKDAGDISIEGNIVKAQAGAILSSVASKAAEAGLSGLEFASGIPGSIGGAIYMNAGAYGGEMKDILSKATILMADGQIKVFSPEELDLSYRHSALMNNGGIVLSVEIVLQPGDSSDIKARIADIRNQRIEKQPLNYPSAGSTFKRPEGYFAGKLIDDVGLRGYRVGGAQVSEKHCGFVVNIENATCADVIRLMTDVDRKVYSEVGVHLEPEVRIVGRNL